MRGWGKEDVRSVEQERKRSFVWTRPTLSCGPDPDDPIYHDQQNDERIDKHEFGGSYMHPNYPSTIFLKKRRPLIVFLLKDLPLQTQETSLISDY